ncbi:MAG: alpha/beta hydrolase [Asgard group archaeon]|nr:alpha/beta hydrolase [Asgard group archaeon]
MIENFDNKTVIYESPIKEQLITVSDNEKVKVIAFMPEGNYDNSNSNMPIIFIGGWLAHLDSYTPIINKLRQDGHEVIYIETREKNSSSATEGSDLTGERIFRDIQEILYNLEIDEPFIMLGHSLGAICSLLQPLQEDNPRFIPKRIIALQPVIKSVIQKEQLGIFKLPTWLFKMFRKLMVKLAPFFSHKLKESDYSRTRFEKEFLEADPGKLRKSAIGFSDFSLLDYLTAIDIPILFLGISEDEQHPIADAKKLTQMLPQTKFIDLISEEAAFSSKTADIIQRFLRTNSSP